jgi:hypothetical protein
MGIANEPFNLRQILMGVLNVIKDTYQIVSSTVTKREIFVRRWLLMIPLRALIVNSAKRGTDWLMEGVTVFCQVIRVFSIMSSRIALNVANKARSLTIT